MRKPKRVLEPIERISEFLFGLIMVLTLTCTFNAVGANRCSVRTLLMEALGCNVTYGGDDTTAFERAVRAHAPDWAAYDMKVMADRFQSEGMLPAEGDVDRLVGMLGRPLRRYRDFAAETAARWRS